LEARDLLAISVVSLSPRLLNLPSHLAIGKADVQEHSQCLPAIREHNRTGAKGSADTGEVALAKNALTIVDFEAIEEEQDIWTFQGKVTGENVAGLVVRFGGLRSLRDQMATVGEDGQFSLTLRLGPREMGTATARTNDWWGNPSNVAHALVRPTR
jgi:hypothetical protein